mmetsp:Transcript_124810/g.242907  ORF Transcript_124810/g.242907 Transcript_124810/m.242907 type:complete len:83 (+) Transcript_124810:1197-1445(+)
MRLHTVAVARAEQCHDDRQQQAANVAATLHRRRTCLEALELPPASQHQCWQLQLRSMFAIAYFELGKIRPAQVKRHGQMKPQ